MSYTREQDHLETPNEPTCGMKMLCNKKVGDGLYYRVFEKGGHFLHVLGGSKDRNSGSAASLLISPIGSRFDNSLEADTCGRYPTGTLAVARQITHYRVRGNGLGTLLASLAVDYHGKILSDKTNSVGVEKIFDKLAADDGYRVTIASRVTSITLDQYTDPTHPATERHIAECVPSKSKKRAK